MTSVLEGKMGVWLCMDYTQTLLHYILPQPHYILQMNSQTWEGEEGREGGRGAVEKKKKGDVVVGGNLVMEMKVSGKECLALLTICMCVLV